VAKNNDSDGEDGSGSESESSDYWNTNPKKPKSRKEDPKKIKPGASALEDEIYSK
jgi:hypothetical protein